MNFSHVSFLLLIAGLTQSLVAESLVPSKPLPQINIPEGTKLRVFADHKSQGITSPTALCIDEHGRLLVTETWRFDRGIDDDRRRRHWYIEDIACQVTADRAAMYQRWYHKHPAEHYTKYSEKVRMLTDPDGDGTANGHTIFADGFNDPLDGTAAGIFSYQGNVYLACIPHIWNLKDTNNDGVADSRQSIQDGFGVRISLSGHDLNGFALGPDGRIYATMGDRGFNFTTKEGRKYVYPGQGAILRFEPDGSDLEVIHTGLRNPKEIAFDHHGNAITVDNNSDQGDKARIVYIMEGADSGWHMGHQAMHTFHRDIGLKKRPMNYWMQEKMWQPRTSEHPAFIIPTLKNLTSGPSGLTYHPGPKSYPGKPNQFFVCDFRGAAASSQTYTFGIGIDGAGMKITNDSIFFQGCAATDVEFGYDGKMYVTDFISGWKSHEAGRIFSIQNSAQKSDPIIQETAQLIAAGFSKTPDEKLCKLLSHEDMRIRLRAHIELANRNSLDALIASYEKYQPDTNIIPALHSIWGIGIIARKNPELSQRAAGRLINIIHSAQNPEFRAQATRCLGEVPGKIEKQASSLIHLLQDPSLRVRSFAAIAIGKIKHEPARQAVIKLIEDNADKDVFLRHAGVMALDGTHSLDQLLALKDHKSTSVRLSAAVALRRHKSPHLAAFLKAGPSTVRQEAIRAIHDLEINEARPAVAAIIDKLVTLDGTSSEFSPIMQQRLIHSAFRLGGDQNIKRLIAFAGSKNPSIDIRQRREALRLLSIWNTPHVVDQSTGRYSPLPPRNDSNLHTILQKELGQILTTQPNLLSELLALSAHYQLQLSGIPSDKLTAIINDQKIDARARAQALKSLATTAPEGFDKALVQHITDPKSHPIIAAEALTLLEQRQPGKNSQLIINATASKELLVRQTAWKLLATATQADACAHLAKAVQTITQGTPGQFDPGSALEVIESAKANKNATVAAALAAYQKSLDPKDPLAAWRITLSGGDPITGAELFRSHGAAQCMRCHTTEKHHDISMAGPNLHSVGKRGDATFLLESLVNPGAKTAPGFGIVSLVLKDGKSISGTLMLENKELIKVKVGQETLTIARANIASQTGPISSMPPMGYLLKPREIRDIVAYLSTLK